MAFAVRVAPMATATPTATSDAPDIREQAPAGVKLASW